MEKWLSSVGHRLSPGTKERITEIIYSGTDSELSKLQILPLMLSEDKYRDLQYIADLLNRPQIDKDGNEFPQYALLRTVVEGISQQDFASVDWTPAGFESLIGGPEYNPAPGSPLYVFNEAARYNAPILKVIGLQKNKEGEIAISATTESTSPVGGTVWLLWEHYFRNQGWRRIKRCRLSSCSKWFVDRTRNRIGQDCCTHHTNLFHSWKYRKERKKDQGGNVSLKKTTARKTKGGKKNGHDLS